MNRKQTTLALTLAALVALSSGAAMAQSEMTSKIRLECAGASTECPGAAAQYDFSVAGSNFSLARVGDQEAVRLQNAPDLSTAVFEVVGQPTSGIANLMRLTNLGSAGIQFLLDRTSGNDWQFSNFGVTFQVSVPGSATPQFVQNANGNLTIGGTLTELSSRTMKENFENVDGEAVLERLADLPIQEWSYKASPEARHIGPTTEDFQAAFGIGQSGLGLASVDVHGVTLVALQALQAEVKDRDAQIAKLAAAQAELMQRLEALEKNQTSGN